MTVSSQTNRTTYTGSGNTGPFSIGFEVSEDTAFSVVRSVIATGEETLLTLNAGTNGYTVNSALTEITTSEAVTSAQKLVITLKEPLTQGVNYIANNTFPAEVTEQALDKLTRICLQQQEQLNRSLKFPVGSSSTDASLPDPDEGKALLWDDDGNLVNSDDNFNTIVSDAQDAADDAESSASSAASSASAASASATSASNSASAAASSESNAASSESNAATSASQAETAANAASIKWLFDSNTTTASDPGTGDLRMNNATISSVTEIAVSDLSASTGNPDVSGYVLAWDDSSNTANRGTLIIRKANTPATFAIFHITGSSTDASGFTRLSVTYVTGNGSLSNGDTLFVSFIRSGDMGADGLGTLNDVVDDTTPQLGGDLDVNGHSIVTVSNGNITLTPHGTGKVLGKNSVDLGEDSFGGYYIGNTPDGTYYATFFAHEAGTITSSSTKCTSGTATATININGVEVGGGSHSVSSSTDTVSRSSDNTFSAGDEITVVVSSGASLVDFRYDITYTRG